MKARNVGESFNYAGRGIVQAFKGERNIRIHLAVAGLVAAASVALGLDGCDAGLVALAVAAVISAEMMNSAIERCVDLITEEYHPLAAAAKNIAAGAVLIATVGAVVVGILVFGPRILALINMPR